MNWFSVLKRRRISDPRKKGNKKGLSEKDKAKYYGKPYTKPKIQIERDEAKAKREKERKEFEERRKKFLEAEEKRKKTPQYKNDMKIKEFAKKEREKYGIISCRNCGSVSIPSPFVYNRNPKKCGVCGNKLEVVGKDFTHYVKPNEYKADDERLSDDGLNSIDLNPAENPDAIDWEKGDPRFAPY